MCGAAAARAAALASPATGLDAVEHGSDAIGFYAPFGTGGETDGSARNFQRSAERLGEGLRFQIIHLTAESGAAASRKVKAAAPDGRTLLLGRVGSLAILPALFPASAGTSAYFTVLDQAPLICAVRAGSAIASMQEFLKAIAAEPGRLRYSTAGAGTVQHVAVRYLLLLNGLPDGAARPQHFTQGSQATQALLDGAVDFSCNNARSVVPQVQAGTLRGLMTTAQGRLKALPQPRNAAELGLRDTQQLRGRSALLGPQGMPATAVARWRGVLDRVGNYPEWQAGTEALGASGRIRAIPDPAQYLRQQSLFYERMLALLGARP